MTDDFEHIAFCFIEYSDFDKLTDVFKEFFHRQLSAGIDSFSKKRVNLKRYFNPPPGEAHLSKVTFWRSANYPDKIFYMANSQDGWFTLCCVFQNVIDCAWFHFSMSDLKKDDYPYNGFIYSPKEGVERAVRTMLDIGYGDKLVWDFCEMGETAWFENPEYYKARFKTKRMNKEILFEYLNRIGIDFYKMDENITDMLTFEQKAIKPVKKTGPEDVEFYD